MFESAEIDHEIPKSEYEAMVDELRARLLEAQRTLLEQSKQAVLVVIAGVDGGGKGETVQLINSWLDPRQVRTVAFGDPSDEERDRPPLWRYWRMLPPKGKVGIFAGSWYSQPIADRIVGKMKRAEMDDQLDDINRFESRTNISEIEIHKDSPALLRNLHEQTHGHNDAPVQPPQGAVVVAHDLSPSRTAMLDKKNVLGFATDVGGTSNDRYRLLRGGMSAEREALGCSHRLSLEHETRRHQDSPRSDGRSNGLQWNSLCPLVGTTSWTWGLGVRVARDVPPDPERVGGTQHQAGLGLRASGPLPASMRLDASLRYTRLADRDGYSPLLENGAAREIGQTQFNLELTRPLGAFFGGRGNGTEWVLQLQHTRQSSNLVIFRYQGTSTFSGLRARW